MATDKRLKQLERDCHLAKIGEAECENRSAVEDAWKDFTKLSDQYRDVRRKWRLLHNAMLSDLSGRQAMS
ncbi:unnamed protein product [Strongylus vulgaris]|uniref:Uncharacterized protein n=1 Tax=Strongylus vulgaris TaxID=40348 RepID=A0A3P7IHM5_STRVU|nr:unnamed protein product [Strongylus vulgaris]